MKNKNPKADFYFHKNTQWQTEIERLRSIVLSCKLNEELKWGCPCYLYENSNIVLIHVFKEYCALLFFKGALLKDTSGVLIQQTKNVQAARQMRFTSAAAVKKSQSLIKAYIKEAIEIEKAGLKVEMKKTAQFPMPPELEEKFNEDTRLKTAFYALTPGRQRGYLLHFSSAKQRDTRISRIEKYTGHILKGKGLDDRS